MTAICSRRTEIIERSVIEIKVRNIFIGKYVRVMHEEIIGAFIAKHRGEVDSGIETSMVSFSSLDEVDREARELSNASKHRWAGVLKFCQLRRGSALGGRSSKADYVGMLVGRYLR